MKTRVLSIAVMLGYALLGYGQDNGVKPSADLPKLVPPSPTAFEMTKYGEFPVGLYTGTPMVNVPITVYGTKNIQVPISLDYSSNGIKVDQMSSNVGLGWSLTVGGVISRIVKGKEDENYRRMHPIEEINRVDLLPIAALNKQPSIDEPTINVKPEIVSFLYNSGKKDYIDSESDLFSYNIQGRSGKIVMDNEGVYRTVPHTNLRIERDFSLGRNNFKLTTEDGVQYEFNAQERTYAKSRCDNGVVSPPEQGYTTSWYLTKITHPKGDEVYFRYDDKNDEYTYTSNYTQSLKLATSYPLGDSEFPVTTGVSTCETVHRVQSKRLIEISSNNASRGKVVFDNSLTHPAGILNFMLVKRIRLLDEGGKNIEEANLNYTFTSNKRVFLESVSMKNTAKKYAFDYENMHRFPKRFAISQDYWGFYNGKGVGNLSSGGILLPDLGDAYPVFKKHITNLADRRPDASFSKIGLLNKITFPTKGFTKFEYEGNDYYGTESKDVYITALASKRGPNTHSSGILDLKDYQLPLGQLVPVTLTGQVSGYVNTAEGCLDFPKIKASAIVKIYEITGGSEKVVYQKVFTNDTNLNEQAFIQPAKTYKVVVLRDPNGDSSKCITANVIAKATKTIGSFKNLPTGGNRIARVQSYDSDSQKLTSKRYYYFKSLEQKDQSSGDATRAGLGHVSYYTQYKLMTGLAPSYRSQGFSILNTSGTFPIVNSGSSNVYYSKVFVSYGGDNFEIGGKEHKFIIHRNRPGETLLGEDRAMSNFTNFGWDHGLEKSVKFLSKPSAPNALPKTIKEVVNDYKLDRTVSEISNYSVSEAYNFVGTRPATPTYKCSATDVAYPGKPIWQCQTNHTHEISTGGLLDPVTLFSPGQNNKGPLTVGNMKCHAFGSHNLIVRYSVNPCYNRREGELVSYSSLIRNLHIYKYKTYSYWHYLNKKTETLYDVNGENPITNVVNYFYDNVQHLQLSRTETRDSKGGTIISKMFYPGDKAQLSGLNTSASQAVDELVRRHQHALPLQVETYKNGQKLSVQRTNYKSFGSLILPELIQISKGTSTLENRMTFHSYDSKGNPREVSKQDGTRITYLWGYDYNHPIAKIENASYAQVKTALGKTSTDNLGYLQTMTEAKLQLEMTKLRANLPTAQVSSYTYIPLVGVSTITDPRGQKMTYHYDTFNRLQYVKDSQGNILKEHKYNYKN